MRKLQALPHSLSEQRISLQPPAASGIVLRWKQMDAEKNHFGIVGGERRSERYVSFALLLTSFMMSNKLCPSLLNDGLNISIILLISAMFVRGLVTTSSPATDADQYVCR